ncbi:signal peptide peptidase SppA [Salinibacter altiplanensis]|uniref:signal peptide peptidase SppA n=1 Tax=Salinibacter altiplanensis TaxID=1803181 RepID=UPI000C9F9B3F|nr:signal peptide peptidase SppA [Salinibacter altiplanensis]
MRFLSTLAANVIGTLVALGLVVFFFVFFFFAVSLSADQSPTVQSGSVLTVPLSGDIPERVTDDPFQKAFGGGPKYDLRALQTSLRKASSDARIEAVWLRTKGLSADWATLEEVREAVVQARESGLPVLASSGEFGMTEKDYFVASAADSVFTAPQSSFEYNGFGTTVTFFDGALQRLEVEPQLLRAGKYKSAGEPFVRSDLSAPNREQLRALLGTTNEQFMTAVSEARGISSEALNRLAEEDALLTSSAARDENLVDGLRYEDEVRFSLMHLMGDTADSVADAAELAEEGDAVEIDTVHQSNHTWPPEDIPDVDLNTISLSEYKRVSPSSASVSYTGTGTVDIVYAEGSIVAGDPDPSPLGGSQALGSTTLKEAMETARTSSQTKAVVLRVNSPGGSAAASEAMWRAVKRTADEKPVIVSMGDVAASGGYYLAAGADSILAAPTTTTGSIGVFGLLVNAEGFFEEKLGVTFDGVRTSPYADLYSTSKPLSPDERRLLGGSIDATYDTFLQRVADARGMDVEAVDQVAQGRVWSGQDAKEVGLVDTTGTLADAISAAGAAADLGEGPYRTRALPQPKTLVERFSEQFATQARQMWRSATTNALERKFWRQKQMLDRVVGTHGSVQARLPFEPTID